MSRGRRGHPLRLVRVRAALQEGIAFGLVQHQIEQQHGGLFPHPRLQTQQVGPQALVVIAVEHAFEQMHHQLRQLGHRRQRAGRGLERIVLASLKLASLASVSRVVHVLFSPWPLQVFSA